MSTKTRALTAWLFIALMGTSLLAVNVSSAEPFYYVSLAQATEEADKLNSLGLFLGSGSGYDLERAPTRAEGLVMLIRMLGEEAEAKNCPYTHPFHDVPAWADRYAAWAYSKGYTKGTSATTFTPNANITAAEYITFMLRALGYGNNVDPKTAVAKAIEVCRRPVFESRHGPCVVPVNDN